MFTHTHTFARFVCACKHTRTHAHTHTPIILPSWNSQKQTTALHSDGQLACFVGKSAIYISAYKWQFAVENRYPLVN